MNTIVDITMSDGQVAKDLPASALHYIHYDSNQAGVIICFCRRELPQKQIQERLHKVFTVCPANLVMYEDLRLLTDEPGGSDEKAVAGCFSMLLQELHRKASCIRVQLRGIAHKHHQRSADFLLDVHPCLKDHLQRMQTLSWVPVLSVMICICVCDGHITYGLGSHSILLGCKMIVMMAGFMLELRPS